MSSGFAERTSEAIMRCGVSCAAVTMVAVSGPALAADDRRSGLPDPVIEARNVIAIQHEAGQLGKGPYDWGPSVMRDGDLYKMWWVRLGGGSQRSFPYATTLPSGERVEFNYPDRGDRIFYAESRDGLTWHLTGPQYAGPIEQFGPDARGPLMVLGPSESAAQHMHLACPSVIKVDGVYYLYSEACGEFIVNKGPDDKIAVGDEYHNQVFLAISRDGKRWQQWPADDKPQPIVQAPDANRQPGRQRYGLGQPSVFYRRGRYVMHYIDSCTGPGDFVVRIEADNPYFRDPRVFPRSLGTLNGDRRIPAGAVARFAQFDVKRLDDTFLLLRPAYGTGNLGIMATRSGLFQRDLTARSPAGVFPQITVEDPRGPQYRERLFPRFLTGPEGEILVQNGKIVIFLATGLGFKEQCETWDLLRCELPLEDLKKIGH